LGEERTMTRKHDDGARMVRADLSAVKVASLVKAKRFGRHRVSAGLYLQVKPGGASWLFRYMTNRQPHWAGLGKYRTADLATARKRARQHTTMLDQGIDPLDAKRQRQTAQKIAAAKNVSFGACAKAYIAARERAWKNDKHAAQWYATFQGTRRSPAVTADINNLPVGVIDTDMVKRCLEPIWAKTPETANRARQRIEKVLDYAKASKYRDGDNPARWHGHLENLLAKPTDLKKRKGTRHHPALPYKDAYAFMTALRGKDSVSARALEFTALTAARTNEVVHATWTEIDFKERTWTVPAARMKAHREHRVPLSDRALEILAALPRDNDDDNPHLFAGRARGAPLSNMAMLETMRDLRPGYVPHGLRSTFRDWAAEQTNFPRDVCETALAHAKKDKTEAAYQRGDLFAKRRELMQQWSGYCASPPPVSDATVTRLRRGKAS
jgi:integrase